MDFLACLQNIYGIFVLNTTKIVAVDLSQEKKEKLIKKRKTQKSRQLIAWAWKCREILCLLDIYVHVVINMELFKEYIHLPFISASHFFFNNLSYL